MGRASSSKRDRNRHLSDAEKARREAQASKVSKGDGLTRDRAGVVVLDDPETTFALQWRLSVPGSPQFRSPYPATASGKITANTEGDLMRDLLLTVIEQYGFQRNVRAIAGVIAHAVNAYPQAIRNELFRMIATGSGLAIYPTEVVLCAACGAERDTQSILDPHAPEGEQLEEEDCTVHNPNCPTQPQVDAEAMAAEPEGSEPIMRAGTPVEWVTRQGVYIDNPQLYAPLFKPTAVAEASEPEQPEQPEPEPIPLDRLDEEMTLPEEATGNCDD